MRKDKDGVRHNFQNQIRPGPARIGFVELKDWPQNDELTKWQSLGWVAGSCSYRSNIMETTGRLPQARDPWFSCFVLRFQSPALGEENLMPFYNKEEDFSIFNDTSQCSNPERDPKLRSSSLVSFSQSVTDRPANNQGPHPHPSSLITIIAGTSSSWFASVPSSHNKIANESP